MTLVPVKNISLRIIWVYSLFFLFRLTFHIIYRNELGEVGVWEYWVGLLFDSSSFIHLFGAYVLFELLAIWLKWDFINRITLYLYMLGVVVLITLNSIDLIYFSFTSRRTTSDVLSFVENGNDLARLIPSFLVDFWYILIPFVLLILSSIKIFMMPFSGVRIKKFIVLFFSLLVIPLMIIMSRGGLQLKPITVISASKYVNSQNTSLVLNTTFTFITTLVEPTVSIPEYFESLEESENIYSPITSSTELIPNKKNVVLLIVESLAKEYIGAYGNSPSYTPFIDSLMEYSTSFNYAFANGKRSIEALPAIMSGIPTLMQTPIIYSPFAANQIGGIPSTLNKFGYVTQFYHGGHNGTMGFEEYCKNVGFDKYIGMDDYPEQKDYDGAWGIFDEPFLDFMATELNEIEQPFFASVFTLSSHHPYGIPKQHKGRFPKGTLRIHETIGYVDYSIGQFFKAARSSGWYDNTIFVITADHTAQLEKTSSSVGQYSIPVILFDPSKLEKKEINKVVQQTDLYPTIMKMLGVGESILSYGRDMLGDEESLAVSYNGGVFQVIGDDYVYVFNGDERSSLFEYRNDSLALQYKKNLEIEKIMKSKTKAIIDSYSKRMKTNSLTVD